MNNDLHADDTLATAVILKSDDDFAIASRFDVVGSISDQTDVDMYRVSSPEVTGAPLSVLTVTLKSLAAGRLVPKLSAFDSVGNPIPITILANGGGELVAQITGIQPDNNYYLAVAADDPAGPFNTGNYQLTAAFSDQAANFQTFAASTLDVGTGQNVHTLYVAAAAVVPFPAPVGPGQRRGSNGARGHDLQRGGPGRVSAGRADRRGAFAGSGVAGARHVHGRHFGAELGRVGQRADFVFAERGRNFRSVRLRPQRSNDGSVRVPGSRLRHALSAIPAKSCRMIRFCGTALSIRFPMDLPLLMCKLRFLCC